MSEAADDSEQASQSWVTAFATYKRPSHARSVFEIAITVVPLLIFWGAALFGLAAGAWWGFVMTIPAAGFVLRLFMIQHDCGHGSLFRRRSVNDWVGRVVGVLTFTPYDYWRRTHAVHHATAGNLDQRGVGDVATLTVAEYRALPRWRRIGYRIYRNPLFLVGVGSFATFVVNHRLPLGFMRDRGLWLSTMATNAAIIALAGGLIAAFGFGPWLFVQVALTLLAGGAGVWLFFVQHQFEETYWAPDEAWDFEKGALDGSSHYDLPPPLRWLTANIGVHHVHHLASRVPFYRLGHILRDYPELRDRGRMTLRQSFRSARLALWDEDRRRLVSFREAAVV